MNPNKNKNRQYKALMNALIADSQPKRTWDGVHVSARHLLRPAERETEIFKSQNFRGPGCSAGQNQHLQK